MREILFRAKRFDNGEWVESHSFIRLQNDEYAVCFLGSGILGKVYFNEDSNIDAFISRDDCVFYQVNPETVGQFTGMLDKYGKKIFEGDIVRAMMDYGPAGMIESVVDIGFKKHDGYRWNYFDLDTIEIIGNIHDNPELVEVK